MQKYLLQVFFSLLICSSTASADDLEKDLSGELRESKTIVASAKVKASTGGDSSSEVAKVKLIAEKIRAGYILLQERYKSRSATTSGLNGKAADRQEATAGGLLKALEEYLALIDAIPPDNILAPSVLDRLLTALYALAPPKKSTILGSLPYKHLGYPAKEPASSPDIAPAYKGGDRTVTAADTASTPEAPISKDISELAQSLNWNPVLIYEWVKNNVETEWYWGAMKGAEETLRQKGGNNADQSALLVALLRASGFPARYVKGTMEFFPDISRAKNLIGLDDRAKMYAFLQRAGIPVKPVISAGRITNLQIEHIWVESYIPYANYRGAVLDDQGKIWVALDTSIKPLGYTRIEGAGVPAEMLATLRNDYLGAMQTLTPLDYLKDKLNQSLPESQPGKSWVDLADKKALIPDVLKILPASMQFPQIAITGEYQSLPEELKHKITITGVSQGAELFNIQLDAMKVSNKRLALRYEPETVEDQATIDSFGGLDNTPPYLVRLRPVLTLDGERLVVAQDGLPMGADYTLKIDVITPNGSEQISSSQIIGNVAVIGIVAQKTQALAAISEADDAEAILHKEAIGYIDRWNKSEDDLAALLGQRISRPTVTIATVGGQIDVTYLMDSPHDFQWKGIFLDAGYRRIETVGRNGNERDFMRLSALEGSILENRIFEDDLKVDSVSTAKLLQLTVTSGTQTVTIDNTNSESTLPTLPFDEAIKTDIVNAVNQGLTVTIPQNEVGYLNWSGIGYIKENTETGESGWMLSGQVAGGMTAVRKDQWVQKDLADSLSLPYSSTPNNDPNSVRRLVRITSSDYQEGTVGKTLPQPLQVMALDGTNRPVKNVQVVFRSIAGGGVLGPDAVTTATAGVSEYRIATGADGIARAYLALGTKTADSPYFIMQNKPYAVQTGQNMINVQADISGGALATDKPFEAYAFPGDAVNIVKVAENTTDNKWGLPGLFAGSVWVLVTDTYGNPISNKQVTFSVDQQVYRLNPPPFETQEVRIRNARLLKLENSCPGAPTIDCTDSIEHLQVTSNITGAIAEVVLGNTDGTDFTITASALKDENGTETSIPLQQVSFTYHSYGITERSDDTAATYLTASVMHHFDSRGNRIDAGKAGTLIPQPLTVTLYRSEETTVSAIKDNCSTSCYYLKGTGIFQTSKVNDGTVSFSVSQGGGSVSPAVVPAPSNDQTPSAIIDGIYKTRLTLGQTPALNVISVLASTSSPVKQINTSTGETLSPNKTIITQTSLNIWGVLPRLEPEQWILINSKGYPTADVPLGLSVKPDEYPVGSLSVRFYENGLWGYMGEVPVQRAGGVLSAGGAVFDPKNSYQAKLVLFDSEASNVESDPVPIKVVAVDLAIDSENTSGLNPDGTHKDPQRTVHSEAIEDAPDLPGKYIPLNDRDTNKDEKHIPDFADGYDLTSSQPTDNGSAAFVPILLEIPEPIDTTQAQVRFIYNASDPAGVSQSTTGEYLPAPGGHIRLWNKDGIKGRLKASIASGGNYIRPADILNISQLGDPIAPGTWRLYVEGVTFSTQLGEELIRVDIDPDGNGPSPFMMADEVRATVNKPLLITDYNRDRTIDDRDRLRGALGNTFYFWVNDDMDSGDISEDSDIPEYRTVSQILSFKSLNGKDSKVNGTRDLEDFFPVYFDLQEMLAKFDPSAYDFVLKQEDSAVNMVFPGLNASGTGLKADESGTYLTDATDNGVAKGLADRETYKVTKTGIKLNNHAGNPAFLQNIIAEKKGVILLEGNSSTSHPLVLEIIDRGTGKTVVTSSLNLSIAGVEQMFRHKNLIETMSKIDNHLLSAPPGVSPIPGHPVPNAGKPDRVEAADFDNSQHFTGFDNENDGTDFVFVHGLNINGDEARGVQAGIFKRLFWSGSRARFWGITWYGWDSQSTIGFCFGTRSPKYHHNVRHAYNAGLLLKNFIKNQGILNPTIAGHSLGNVVVSTAIQNDVSYSRYFMINAAVAEEAYIPENAYTKDESGAFGTGSNWYMNTRRPMYHPAWRYPNGQPNDIGYDPFLWSSEWYTLFDKDDVRSTLTWRNYFGKIRMDARVYSFFTPTDEAFKPFNYNPFASGAPTDPRVYPANVNDWPGLDDVLAEWLKSLCFDNERLGNYAWSMQELLKGRMSLEGFAQGGWGFNNIEGGDYKPCITLPDDTKICNFITPSDAYALDREKLKSNPLFNKNPDNAFLFTINPVKATSPDAFGQKQMDLLASEIPALTFATGHRGVERFDNNIDIKKKYLEQVPGASWPRKPLTNYEWRHNDLYNVGYPYTFRMFDDFVSHMK